MVFGSPADALGSHTAGTRDLLIEVVRSRHDRAAEAHQVSGSRYAMGFGSQWRDLLDDTRDALVEHGYQSCKLAPAGYELPVVHDCLVYTWRVPDAVDAVSHFASSPTRRNGFGATPPDPMLFDPGLGHHPESEQEFAEEAEVERLVRTLGDTMPVVLVMVHSSPRQFRSIEWAIAVLDDAGRVSLHGQEEIWAPEAHVDAAASDGESFDSGTPIAPAVVLRKQEGTPPDA